MKKIIIALIPKSLMPFLKRVKLMIDEVLMVFFAKSALGAWFYYTFFSRQFDREHKAVLAGRAQYKDSLTNIGVSSALLRRNIHRLEKGLIMQPRRAIFAEDYILETVENFSESTHQGELCKNEWKWAADVLTEYFSIVGSSTITLKARELFEAVEPLSSDTNKSIPYPYAS